MIQATQLRIGNYLKYKNTNDLAIVELIHKKHFDCRDEYGLFTPNGNYEPINLTEEWLLKFGFKRFPWGLVKDNLLFKDDLKCSYIILQVGNGFEAKVKHVHQLQNLYFALTNKELNYETTTI